MTANQTQKSKENLIKNTPNPIKKTKNLTKDQAAQAVQARIQDQEVHPVAQIPAIQTKFP